MTNFVQVVAVLLGAAIVSFSPRAEACGCFAQTPQSLGTPVVQAGERILFAVDNGKVTAHIQIQYSGDAKEFGWLVPLPSVPVVKVGSEELFTLLLQQTQPTYRTTTVFTGEGCQRQSPGLSLGCSPSAVALNRSAGGFQDSGAVPPAPSPVVIQATVGPYDYAVLKADDRAAMVTWLADNRYTIPTGADDVVAPYIRPGAYFLALKLTSGASTGDIAPVVLEYASALPMIPITLTSIGAQPNMGVQVWMVGPGRAIPRNYHHVVINDAQLDWANGAGNYSAVVTAAVATAPTKHAFVTEYAGTSTVMRDTLVPPGRFGTVSALAAETTPHGFVRRLFESGFSSGTTGTLPSQVKRVVLAAVPYPPALQQRGVSDDQFLNGLEYYLGAFRTQNPDVFVNYQLSFDAPTLAREVFSTFVATMREANALFTTFPTLTRLYTTLSPADMNRDPVFSFNPSLPEVSKDHRATLESSCLGTTLVTEQGYRTPVQPGAGALRGPAVTTLTSATRLETLGEEGPATVVVDNAAVITAALTPPPAEAAPSMPTGGCAAVDPTSLALVVLVARLRRRRG